MSDEKMIAVANKLLEQSQRGKVAWSADSLDESTFSVEYPTYSVSIRRPRGRDFYMLSVNNQYGTALKSLEIPEGQDGYETLKELFEIARRIGLKSDEVLDDLLVRLSSDG